MIKKLSLLILALIFATNSYAATQLKKTVKPSGGDYTSLEACMNANEQDLTAADKYFDVEIDGTWSSADTSAVMIHNYTTDATRYINIYTTSAARHRGVYSTSYYRLEPNADYVCVCYVDYTTITGVQGYADGKIAIFYDGGGTARTLSKVLTKGSTTYHCYGWNNIINSIGYGTASNFARDSTNVYSCTAIGMSIPFRGITTAKNCYGGNNTGGYDFYDVTNMTTCASSDNTGSVGLRTIAVNTTNFTNVTGGSENFHLPLGSALIDVGTNTSGDAAPLNFTDDIDGVTRTGTWDIGADEYVSATTTYYIGRAIWPGIGRGIRR